MRLSRVHCTLLFDFMVAEESAPKLIFCVREYHSYGMIRSTPARTVGILCKLVTAPWISFITIGTLAKDALTRRTQLKGWIQDGKRCCEAGDDSQETHEPFRRVEDVKVGEREEQVAEVGHRVQADFFSAIKDSIRVLGGAISTAPRPTWML